MPINAHDRGVYQPANRAIEGAYRLAHASHDADILTGSEFIYGGAPGQAEVTVPRGASSRGHASAFLSRFRGVSRQLAPDIIDFHDRVMYEIKTPDYADEGVAQLSAAYRLAQAIEDELNGPPWVRDYASWYPPHVLPLPGHASRVICTSDTWHVGDLSGLILYRVLERRSGREEERSAQAQQVARPVVTELFSELNAYRPSLDIGLARDRTLPAREPVVLVAPRSMYLRLVGEPRMERTLDLMRVHGLEPRRNPVIGYHNLWVTLVGITAALEATVFYAPLALELGAAGAVGAAATAEGGGAVIISLAARRAALAAVQSSAAREAARAAAVLLVAWVGTRANDAQAAGRPGTPVTAEGGWATQSIETLRAVPASRVVGSTASLRLGAQVTLDGENLVVVGHARSVDAGQAQRTRDAIMNDVRGARR